MTFDIARLAGGLVVSCQAPPESPLRSPEAMAAMADAAVLGGAAAIRANGAADVAAIRRRVAVPIIGLVKRRDAHGVEWITPLADDVRRLAAAGADVVALDATLRPRPFTASVAELIAVAHDECSIAVLGDIDGVEAAVAAAARGADAVATTLAGYTPERPSDGGPDIELIRKLHGNVGVPIVAEGRFRGPGHVADAFAAGATTLVVGSAITDPLALTRRFVGWVAGAVAP